MTLAVSTHGISKRYRLGGLRPGSLLYEELGSRLRLRARRDEQHEEERRWVWALRDVSFDAEVGEVVGIVGRNGAGKSTLLRVLSRITEPTEGTAEVRGRLASLLEVGTGFHPELTGRENIYLNGSILGLTKRDITARFDQIVEFSEIERFLDTPVKRYSSGMYMRLAFAVAAHLEPDVLVVDEVLAVGDAAFQRKCLGRMEAIAGSGRTVLFVSHNMAAVRSLCSSMLLLEAGSVVFRGSVEGGLERYEARLPVGAGQLDRREFRGTLTDALLFDTIQVIQEGRESAVIDPSRGLELRIRGRALRSFSTLDVTLAVFRDGTRLFSCQDGPPGQALPEGPFESIYELEAGLLRPGHYTLGIGARRAERGDWVWADEALRLEVGTATDAGFDERNLGAISVRYEGRRAVGAP